MAPSCSNRRNAVATPTSTDGDAVVRIPNLEAVATTYRPAAMMLAACQIRGARAMMGWSIDELARRSGVSEKTVRRMEKVRGVPNATAETFSKIQACLEAEGFEFLPELDGRIGPGLRWGNYSAR